MPSEQRTLDDVDVAIFGLLQRDGRRGYRSIGRELGIPPETVRFRVNRMLRDGVIHVTTMIHPRYLGGVLATLLISVTLPQRAMVAAEVERRPEVMYLSVCSGRADLIAQAVVRSTEELHQLTEALGSLEGVQDVETFVELDVLKTHYTFGSQFTAHDS